MSNVQCPMSGLRGRSVIVNAANKVSFYDRQTLDIGLLTGRGHACHAHASNPVPVETVSTVQVTKLFAGVHQLADGIVTAVQLRYGFIQTRDRLLGLIDRAGELHAFKRIGQRPEIGDSRLEFSQGTVQLASNL